MADMLQTAAGWLQGELKSYVSRTVIYTRDADSVTIQATLGKDLLKLGDELGGLRMVWTDADLLIAAADLVLAGQTVTPLRGDGVAIPFGAAMKLFEVFAEDGEPPWRWADQYQTLIRIHLKYLGTQ